MQVDLFVVAARLQQASASARHVPLPDVPPSPRPPKAPPRPPKAPPKPPNEPPSPLPDAPPNPPEKQAGRVQLAEQVRSPPTRHVVQSTVCVPHAGTRAMSLQPHCET